VAGTTSTTEHESWNPIPGYEGIYEASTHGRIRSVDRTDWKGRLRSGRVLSMNSQNGPRVVQMCSNGKIAVVTVARLVLLAFSGEAPSGKHRAFHLDGDPWNDHRTNLAWVLPTEFHRMARERVPHEAE